MKGFKLQDLFSSAFKIKNMLLIEEWYLVPVKCGEQDY